jgi:hypothetical protein
MHNSIYSKAKLLLAAAALTAASYAPQAHAQTLATKYNLPRLLDKSILYFEHQISGSKPAWSRSYWRGDSQLNSGDDVGVNLDGGWNDAGDNVKFNFPQAHAVTILCWTQLEYATTLNANYQKDNLIRNIRWAMDYLLRCHPSANVIWGQVGNGKTDHTYWRSPELIDYSFPSYKLDSTKPGTDLACEFAAAFAAGYLVFKDIDATYASTLLTHARQCFTFGDTYRGKYSDSIADAKNFYQSFSGYQDEISWAAAWLYRATSESAFLTRAQNEFTQASGYTPAWDNKSFANSIHLYQLTGKSSTYRTYTENWLDSILQGAGKTHTPGGLLWLQEFGPLPLAVSGAWGAMLYTKIATSTGTSTPAKYDSYRSFAFKQLDYALGGNPLGIAYIGGLADSSPVNFHHRGASGILGYTSEYSDNDRKNTFILEGGLSGGPDSSDGFQNSRSNPQQSEAGVGTNCYLTAAAAAICEEFSSIPPTRPSLLKATTNPTLDGIADNSYSTRYSLGSVLSGATTNTDFSGTWTATWTSTSLYVHVSITDDASSTDSTASFQDDSVEIYLDRMAAGFSTYGAAANPFSSGSNYGSPSVFQYVFKRGATTAVVNGVGGTTTGVTHAWRTITGGYELEASFTWAALGGTRTTDDFLGFDIQVNDDDNGGDRDSQLAWTAKTDVNYRRPDNFGRVQLKPTAPKNQLAGNRRISDNASTLYLNATTNTVNSPVSSFTLNTDYSSQRWILELVTGSTYRIKNVWSGLYLAAPDNNNDTALRTVTLNTSSNAQKWEASSATGTGNFRLKNTSSQFYITAGASSGAAVKQKNLDAASNAQIFKLPTY